jgi:nicotinamide-nucleotide amidase
VIQSPETTDLLIRIAELFKQAKGKLAVVESCTGGGLGAALTSLAGSSEWFEGGIITYSNAAKMRHVYVRESTLTEQGAVSEACVKEMANGGMVALGVDCCISISGVAGPDGGSPEKPVGLVWFGLAVRHKSIEAFKHQFEGDRNQVRDSAVREALRILSTVSLRRAV